jgi:hypothetical protein
MIKCIEVASPPDGMLVHFNNCGRGGAVFSLPASLGGKMLFMTAKHPSRDDSVTCELREDGSIKMLYEIENRDGGRPQSIPIGFDREAAPSPSKSAVASSPAGTGGQQAQTPPQADPAATPTPAIGNADVLDLLKAGLSPALVVAKIKQSKTSFDTSPAALKSLKEAKVPDTVILAMIEAR